MSEVGKDREVGRSGADEEWRDVVGFECHYAVSNLGRVRSLRGAGQRTLVGSINGSGYHCVRLSKNGVETSHRVHRIVCRAFHGEPEPGQEVGHLNASRRDNRAINLRWLTRSENARQCVADGNRTHNLPRLSGTANPAAKFGDAVVEAIRRDAAAGYSFRRLAAKHGVSLSHAHRIVSRESRNG